MSLSSLSGTPLLSAGRHQDTKHRSWDAGQPDSDKEERLEVRLDTRLSQLRALFGVGWGFSKHSTERRKGNKDELYIFQNFIPDSAAAVSWSRAF